MAKVILGMCRWNLSVNSTDISLNPDISCCTCYNTYMYYIDYKSIIAWYGSWFPYVTFYFYFMDKKFLLSVSHELASVRTLLSFSNAIATVRDKKGLELIIKQYLKNIFGVREYLITIKNDDQETYSYFMHDLETDTPADEGFQLITGARMPIAGSMTGEVLR